MAKGSRSGVLVPTPARFFRTQKRGPPSLCLTDPTTTSRAPLELAVSRPPALPSLGQPSSEPLWGQRLTWLQPQPRFAMCCQSANLKPGNRQFLAILCAHGDSLSIACNERSFHFLPRNAFVQPYFHSLAGLHAGNIDDHARVDRVLPRQGPVAVLVENEPMGPLLEPEVAGGSVEITGDSDVLPVYIDCRLLG